MAESATIPVLTPREVIGFPVAPRRINRRVLERIIENTFKAASRLVDSGPAYMTDLLNSWVKADCRWDKWERENPGNAWLLNRNENVGLGLWRARVYPGRDGRPQPLLLGASGFEPDAAEKANGNQGLAFDLFAMFLVAAAPRAEVGICERCGRFYWNRWGHTNKRFCSRKCSQLQTATEAQRLDVAKERRKKNARIRKAVEDFIAEKPGASDWKAWVARRARVTRTYLTRAINRGIRGETDGLKLHKWQVRYLESKGESHGNL